MKLKKAIFLLVCIGVLMIGGCEWGYPLQKKDDSSIQNLDNTGHSINVDAFDYALQQSEELPLLANVVSDDTLRRIASSVCVESQLSAHTKKGELSGVNDISPVKELRYIQAGSEKLYYCIYENQKGGRLYVFFRDETFWINGAVYFEKKLTFSDFISLREGESTKKDVVIIDSSVNENITQNWDGFNGVVLSESTFHITTEGYVEIRYTKEGVVERILKSKNNLMQIINENDLPGEV